VKAAHGQSNPVNSIVKDGLLTLGWVAQLVEQRTENPKTHF
jgi:hypothetical protein